MLYDLNTRMLTRHLLAALMLALASMHAAWGQGGGEGSNPLGDDDFKTKVLIGPVGGAGMNYHTGGFRIISEASCPVFTSGSGWGFLVGLSGEVQPSERWSLVPRLTYESRPAMFKEYLDAARVLVDSVNVVEQIVSTTSDVKFSFINLEVMYSRQVLQLGRSFRLSASAGPAVGYVLGGTITQVQDLEQPLNAQFVNPNGLPTENNSRRLIYSKDRTIDGLQQFRFSVKGGVNAEVGLFNDEWILYPGVYYDFGLTNVTRNENWNLNTIIFQIDLRRAL